MGGLGATRLACLVALLKQLDVSSLGDQLEHEVEAHLCEEESEARANARDDADAGRSWVATEIGAF